jgi:short-subunit dehydrogenase
MKNLEGRTGVLTGATDGLGRDVPKRLAEKGASLVLIARER